ncbi:efflux transporter outer membrane subunit [Sphingomonas sp. BIUV-7]|uniref:Efflux transporter outer membrane subunit n=1 Tax=Sphingomonas natans TaxID=3063330 RepID=A0ABT8Y3Q1_9SPHN|nr:efflux transporter outer membrane subunit [Sphingomonas sp. BIUV-7]MDO6412941.1 efflux transporter outer membrane subunit [Sphingomonas sp. BIUV-7]
MTRRLALALLAGAASLAGCTVGPDYKGPPPLGAGAPPPAFVRADAAAVPTAAQTGRWWTALGDATLDLLEQRALAANADLAAAQARLHQARAGLRVQRANTLPSANVQGTYVHARLPGLSLEQDGDSSSRFDFYNDGLTASWEIDLFGGRRSVEAARAQAGEADAKLADVQVSLTAEVAQAYVSLRDRQRRIALGTQSVSLGEQALLLGQQRLDRGTATRGQIEQARQQLDEARAQLVPLLTQRDAYLDELATLLALAPGALDAELGSAASAPLPPREVAIGDPAALLRNRPDIRAAERELALQTAKVGVADAARFPAIKFMGIFGLGGTSPSDLVDPGKLTALLAPQISWSFLDFGRNRAKLSQAEAVRDEAEAKYRTAVLAGLRDAEGALARFRDQRLIVADRARALASATTAADIAAQRERAGTATKIDAADAERRRLSAESGLAAEEAALTAAFIGVEKSLGLGWS